MIKSYLELKQTELYKNSLTGLIMDGNEWLEYFAEDCIGNEVLPSQLYWVQYGFDKNLSINLPNNK
jgi:hypothetical protein